MNIDGRAKPLLVARQIRKSFGGVNAVQGVDFHVNQGEIVGLIGPNGSGKSTLLACLSGDTPSDDGRVAFGSADVTNCGAMRMARTGLGRTFQNVRVFNELTVTENALLSRNWSRVSAWHLLRGPDAETRRRASMLLELAEMESLSNELAGSLSGGQKRLLEFVMAHMSEPRLVMLDEAASGINPTLVEKLREHLLELRARENVAYVIVEHNIDFVFSTVDRVVVLSAGRVLDEGAPEVVRANQEVVDVYLGV